MNPSLGVVLLLALGGGTPVPVDGLPPSELATSRFDASHALGRPDENERADALDVPTTFRRLIALAHPADPAAEDAPRNLGDVLARLRPAKGAPRVDERVQALARRAPSLVPQFAWTLPQLLNEHGFRAPGWKGRRDLADDGFLSLRGWWPWYRFYRERWPRFDATTRPEAYQVVTLIFHAVPDERLPRDAADAIARVRRAARDFTGCTRWRGLSLRPSKAELVRGSTWVAEGKDELSYAVSYEFSAPWPPSFVVEVRERMEEDALVVDYYCADGPWDFFAGREEYLPVLDSGGRFVCLLLVATFAAAEVHGDVLMRECLGNVKELAERGLAAPPARRPR